MSAPIALATCAEMPVEADEGPLVAAFERADVAFRWAVWDDPAEDWSRYGGVLIRTTWDYVEKIGAFRSWVAAVDEVTTLWNPAPVVAWNSHKRYLTRLADRGVAVVPTAFVEAAGDADIASTALPDDGGHGYVVKPAEAVGSIGLTRWPGGDAGRQGARSAVRSLHDEGHDVLVQPLLPAIATGGETSIIVVDGAVSHAVRKVPVAGDIRSQPEWGADVSAVRPTDAQLQLVDDALAAARAILGVDDELLYARVDCVDHDSAPHLMELELIEPDLYVGYDPAAADRVVAAVQRRLGR